MNGTLLALIEQLKAAELDLADAKSKYCRVIENEIHLSAPTYPISRKTPSCDRKRYEFDETSAALGTVFSDLPFRSGVWLAASSGESSERVRNAALEVKRFQNEVNRYANKILESEPASVYETSLKLQFLAAVFCSSGEADHPYFAAEIAYYAGFLVQELRSEIQSGKISRGNALEKINEVGHMDQI